MRNLKFIFYFLNFISVSNYVTSAKQDPENTEEHRTPRENDLNKRGDRDG